MGKARKNQNQPNVLISLYKVVCGLMAGFLIKNNGTNAKMVMVSMEYPASRR